MSWVKWRYLCSNSEIQMENYTSRIINKDFPSPFTLIHVSLFLQSSYYAKNTGFTEVLSGGLDIAETADLKHDTGSESYGVPEFDSQHSLLATHAAIILEFIEHFRQELT